MLYKYIHAFNDNIEMLFCDKRYFPPIFCQKFRIYLRQKRNLVKLLLQAFSLYTRAEQKLRNGWMSRGRCALCKALQIVLMFSQLFRVEACDVRGYASGRRSKLY